MALSLDESDHSIESYLSAVVLFYHSFQNGRNFRKLGKFVRSGQKNEPLWKDQVRNAEI